MTEELAIPYPYIKECILNGVKYLYESYNYKMAMEEFNQKNPKTFNELFSYQGNYIPPEIKANHIVWRKGKLREIRFNNDGKMCTFKIGNKYYKTFYLSDFGIKCKPMIFKSDDKLGLIDKGMAVEAEL